MLKVKVRLVTLYQVLPEEIFGPIDYRLGRQVFILESGVRFPVGLLKLVTMCKNKSPG